MREAAATPEEDHQICQALADVATIAILQNQATTRAETVNHQSQRALDSRVAIEQAKGIFAERLRVEMTEAFSRLQRFARDNNRLLSHVATAVVAGTLLPGSPATGPHVGGRRPGAGAS